MIQAQMIEGTTEEITRTPEQVAADDRVWADGRVWEEFEQGINASRQEQGMRSVQRALKPQTKRI